MRGSKSVNMGKRGQGGMLMLCPDIRLLYMVCVLPACRLMEIILNKGMEVSELQAHTHKSHITHTQH